MFKKYFAICMTAAICSAAFPAFAQSSEGGKVSLSEFNKTLSVKGSVRFNDAPAIAIIKAVRDFSGSNRAPVLLFGEKDNLPFILRLSPSGSQYNMVLFQSGQYGKYDALGERVSANGKCSNKAQFTVAIDKYSSTPAESFDISAPLSCLLATDKGMLIKIDVSAGF